MAAEPRKSTSVQPIFRAVAYGTIESRTMVPSTTRSQPAALSLVIGAVKSWSVGLCVVVSTSLIRIFSAWSCTPSSTSFPKSVSWYIAQSAFLPFLDTK